MPYRRLPKTDTARIKTLKCVADLENKFSFHNIPLSYNLLNRAKTQLSLFEHHQAMYVDNCKKWQNNNAKLRETQQVIKTYISHFIQVFNFAVSRGEFRKESKICYNLAPDTDTLPPLNSEENILLWGQNLIDGEKLRVSKGSSPMTNPTISNVKIHYESFKDTRAELQFLRIAIDRTKENFNVERAKTDQLIKEIWDEIENNFSQLPPEERIEACKKCGIIYYNRSSESENEVSDEEYEEMTEYEKEEEINRRAEKKAQNAKELSLIDLWTLPTKSYNSVLPQ